jgi:hypothetical protein
MGKQMVTMSNKDVKKMVAGMKVWTKKVTADSETARKTLMAMGILEKDGKPSKNYYPDAG